MTNPTSDRKAEKQKHRFVIREVTAKNILTKSRLPASDYCINPYVGCLHGCIYCYARFMRRFTQHTEKWGTFLDVKINAADVLRRDLSRHPPKGVALLGSVTDAYQNAERKYRITRSVLEVLLEQQFPISILTKSDLVLRDIDLLKQFQSCDVGLTITMLDEQARRRFEPSSVSSSRRLRCLKMLHNNNIRTYAFIGPILPLFTDLRAIYRAVRGIADTVWAESLNTRCGNWDDIKDVLRQFYPSFEADFVAKTRSHEYWRHIGEELGSLSAEFGIPLIGYYQH